jgi:hypothetical protein
MAAAHQLEYDRTLYWNEVQRVRRAVSGNTLYERLCDAVERPTYEAIRRAVWPDGYDAARSRAIIDQVAEGRQSGGLWGVQIAWIFAQVRECRARATVA